MKESELQKLRQLEASKRGNRLWRNNSGAMFFCEHAKTCPHSSHRPVRFGLGNESAKINRVLKSGDLIGITPTIITPDMIGHTVGIFTSEEIKQPGWKYSGRGREAAQEAWNALVRSLGGIARFVNKLEDV